MGFFSCCAGDRKQAQKEQEARHARIIEIYNQAEAESHPGSSTQAPPPAYHEIVYDSLTGTIIIVDDKQTQPLPQTQPQAARAALSRPASPQTSIYSVPSTRLTDITSAHLGGMTAVAHTYRSDSPRSSLVFDSAPPSYYDGRSMRERSRSPAGHRDSDEHSQLHPVMDPDWLDILQRNAERGQTHTQQDQP